MLNKGSSESVPTFMEMGFFTNQMLHPRWLSWNELDAELDCQFSKTEF